MSKGIVRIITGIPGAGKTRKIDEIFNANPNKRKIYLTFSHKLLDEREQWQKDATHWEGMKRICPCKENELIKNMLEVNAPTSWVCEICQATKLIKKDQCPHKRQFIDPNNTVIAPCNYLLSTNHVKKYNPKIVVVDDVILKKHDLPPLSTIRTYVRTLYCLGLCEYSTVEELFKEKKGEFLFHYIKTTIEPKIKVRISNLIKEGSDQSLNAAKNVLLRIDPMDLLIWRKLVDLYCWQKEFSITLLDKIFELSMDGNREMILVGASLNKRFLEMSADKYERETGNKIIFKFERIKCKPKNSVIYRFRCATKPNAWYPAITSIVKGIETRNNIRKYIEEILTVFRKHRSLLNVGLIKPKAVHPNSLIDPSKVECIVSLDFGNLRGMNQQENCGILFVVGTYVANVKALQKDFELFFRKEPKTTEYEKKEGGGYRYLDDDLENFRRMVEEEEMYQAIHRIRPALETKEVYVFGLIPEKIHTEFEVKELTYVEVKDGVKMIVEETPFEKILEDKVGENGIFLLDLIPDVREEFGLTKQGAWYKIKNYIENHNEEYIITKRTGKLGTRMYLYIRKRG